MPVRLTFGQEKAAQDAVRTLTVAQLVLRQGTRIALRDVDDAVTTHISQRFGGRQWGPLRPMTMYLRSLASGRLPKGVSAGAARRLWYRRQSAKGGAPQSNRSYGWTKIAEAAALRPGKIVTTKGTTLVRGFADEGKNARQRLTWWHFGTKQTVTPRQRAFLHRVGVHLRKGTTVLRREPRPIYDEPEIRRIAGPRFERRVREMMAAFQEGSPGLFSTTVVRR